MNHYEFDPEPSDLKFLWRAMMLVIGLIIGSILGIVATRGADVVYGRPPPVRTCDDLAYLSAHAVIPTPPIPTFATDRPAWREFIGPRQENAPLPGSSSVGMTYEEWIKQPKRRRGQ
jgi:hypothetical protein